MAYGSKIAAQTLNGLRNSPVYPVSEDKKLKASDPKLHTKDYRINIIAI